MKPVFPFALFLCLGLQAFGQSESAYLIQCQEDLGAREKALYLAAHNLHKKALISIAGNELKIHCGATVDEGGLARFIRDAQLTNCRVRAIEVPQHGPSTSSDGTIGTGTDLRQTVIHQQ